MTVTLDELRALEAAATPGPWRLKDRGPAHDFDPVHHIVAGEAPYPGATARASYEDAAFIVAAVQYVRDALSVEGREGEVERIAADHKAYTFPCCGGRRWVEDENWQPENPIGQWTRRPHDGLVPCGTCNFAGWETPENEPAQPWCVNCDQRWPCDASRIAGLRFRPSETLDMERLARAIHGLRWCKASGLLHALAHDETDEDGYRAAIAAEYARQQGDER